MQLFFNKDNKLSLLKNNSTPLECAGLNKSNLLRYFYIKSLKDISLFSWDNLKNVVILKKVKLA